MACASTWHRILDAIERLRAQKPAKGEGDALMKPAVTRTPALASTLNGRDLHTKRGRILSWLWNVLLLIAILAGTAAAAVLLGYLLLLIF